MKLIYQHDGIDQFFEIPMGQSSIGRSSAATFTIRNDTISKVHILIERTADSITIEDLESSNGTFVNGVKIHKQEIKPTDSLKIGKVKFTIGLTPEEVALYGGTSDDDATPVGGVEAVASEEENEDGTKTFFDVANFQANAPAAPVANGVAAEPNVVKTIMGNRKLLLTIVGSISILMMMLFVLARMAKPGKPINVTSKPRSSVGLMHQKYESEILEGTKVFLNQPEKAKVHFETALKAIPGNNSAISLIQLADLWILAEKDWVKLARAEFRRYLDDIRLEDEGQTGALLYEFVNDLSKKEKFEQEMEVKYAEFDQLIKKVMLDMAHLKMMEISNESSLRAKAESTYRATQENVIRNLKEQVKRAQDAKDAKNEIRIINNLLKFLPATEAIEYSQRKNDLKQDLEKESIWEEANKKFDEGNYLEAQELYGLIERLDAHFVEAQEKLAFIKEQNVRKKVELFYDKKGDGNMALEVISNYEKPTLRELQVKIRTVVKLFNDAQKEFRQNPESVKATELLNELLVVENNPENKYNVLAKELLAKWSDPIERCNRRYKNAQDKARRKDFITARKLVGEIQDIHKGFDVSELLKQIEKHVEAELNLKVRNESSRQVKKVALEHLSKMVKRGDRHYEYIQKELLKLE